MEHPFSLPFVEDTHGCSRAGAETALPKAGTQRARVYQAIQAHGPISDAQLVVKTGLPLNVVNARRWSLMKEGLVEDAGTHMGMSGVRNTVWAVVNRKGETDAIV